MGLWINVTSPADRPTIAGVTHLLDPDEYFDAVLAHAEPGGPMGRPRGPVAEWQQWWRRQSSASALLGEAARSGFILPTTALPGLGVSRSTARTAVRRGRWSAPRPGTIAPLDPGSADVSDHVVARRRHALDASAAALCRPGYVVSGRSAAVLHGLPTLSVPTSVEMTSRRSCGLGTRAARHTFSADLSEDEITRWFGVPVTTAARALVDLARHDRRDGLMAADAALRARLTTSAQIDHAVRRAAGWPGIRAARDVLVLADPLAESALESLTRLVLHDDGVPPPRLQWRIGGYRVDFCWPEQHLIVEADGRVKYTADERWQEKVRERQLRRLGWDVERVLWSDLFSGWPATRAQLRSYF